MVVQSHPAFIPVGYRSSRTPQGSCLLNAASAASFREQQPACLGPPLFAAARTHQSIEETVSFEPEAPDPEDPVPSQDLEAGSRTHNGN